jgi:hypothetical protein
MASLFVELAIGLFALVFGQINLNGCPIGQTGRKEKT